MTGCPLPQQKFHISISLQTLYIPWWVLDVKTCQHSGWPGQFCSGLTGLTNCLVYVCLSAGCINLEPAWLAPVCLLPNYFPRARTPELSSSRIDLTIPCVHAAELCRWRLARSVLLQWGRASCLLVAESGCSKYWMKRHRSVQQTQRCKKLGKLLCYGSSINIEVPVHTAVLHHREAGEIITADILM